MKTGLAACAGLPDGSLLKEVSQESGGYFGVLVLGSYVGECGLPTSTMKLIPPALTTCEGAAYKYTSLGSIDCPCITVGNECRHNSTTCGSATKCPTAIRLFNDTVLSQVKTGFTACAALPNGHPLKGFAGYKDYVGIRPLADLTKECGLNASTVTLTPPALTTCEGAVYKYTSLESACPIRYNGKGSYWDGNKTVEYDRWERTPASCGTATACPMEISSINDTVFSAMKTGFAVRV